LGYYGINQTSPLEFMTLSITAVLGNRTTGHN
jgi:hypothetical protein